MMTPVNRDHILPELDRLESELATELAIHGRVSFDESYPRFRAALEREDYRGIAEHQKGIDGFCRRVLVKIARDAYDAGDYMAAAEMLVELRDGITTKTRHQIIEQAVTTL